MSEDNKKTLFRVFYRLSKKRKRFMNVYAENKEKAVRTVIQKINFFQQSNNVFENLEIVDVKNVAMEAV